MKTSHPLRVVIAEDIQLASDVLCAILEGLGHEVVGKAADGAQAVEMTEAAKPQVVLMDISMPNMDGLEATRRIQDACLCPVVLLTGHNDPAMVTRASESGAAAYLVKPPQALDLERTMAIAVARFDDLMTVRRLNQELARMLEEVKTLRGIIPICCHCKKIRDDEGYWDQVEAYLTKHSDARFSHGICPDCLHTLYPGV